MGGGLFFLYFYCCIRTFQLAYPAGRASVDFALYYFVVVNAADLGINPNAFDWTNLLTDAAAFAESGENGVFAVFVFCCNWLEVHLVSD